MKFRTEYISQPAGKPITYATPVFFIGSCFATNVYNALRADKFKGFSNPHGIVYNPVSIANQLHQVASSHVVATTDLMLFNGRYVSLQHHGDFSHSSKEETLGAMNAAIQSGHTFLQSAQKLFITLGTSWVFDWNETGATVANCHKIPAKEFTKRLAEVSEMAEALTSAISAARELNPKLEIVISISPVRHLSNGFFENNVSKARLFEVVHQLRQNIANLHYFAAYEMVLDDLRDYRFYNSDLVHPSIEAVEYVMEQFAKTYFTEATQQQRQQVQKLVKANTHRPFDWHSEAHQNFIANTTKKMKALGNELGIDFEEEINTLSQER